VKTTFSDETPLIFIFRLSDLGAANSFWKDFNEGDLKSTIKTKLQSFPDENNCFKNKDIQFDIFIDEDDFQKVHHTLENPKECKSWTECKIDHMTVILRQEGHLVTESSIPIHHHIIIIIIIIIMIIVIIIIIHHSSSSDDYPHHHHHLHHHHFLLS
jgi:hypothetical protein